ncbi:MAG: outer membrane beta-barrel protein [Acidobacteriota bacterium]
MRGFRSRARATAWGAALSASFLIGVAGTRAQTFRTSTAGLNVGRFILYPSVTFEFTQDSNVLFASSENPDLGPIDSGILVVQPRITVDLPLGASRVRFSYAPLYRDYTTNSFRQTDPYSHFFDLDGTFRIGPSLSLRITEHFVRGTVELQEVDPGREVTFGLVPFTSHEPSLEVNVDVGGRHGFSLIPRLSIVDFKGTGEAVFFNFRRRGLEGRYNYRLTPQTTLFGLYSFEDTGQNREQVLFGDVSIASRAAGIGARRVINEAVVSEVVVGYRSLEFADTEGADFAGPTLDLDTVWRPTDVTRVRLSLLREPFQSFYVNNNYYVSEQARLTLTRQVGHSTYWQVAGSYFENAYSDPLDISTADPDLDPDHDGRIDLFQDRFCDGEDRCPSFGKRRRDRIVRLEAGIGHRFRQGLRAFLGYNFEGRRSNMEEQSAGEFFDRFRYTVNRFLFRLQVGWL